MANQTATNVLAALKREAVFGTEEATGAGADRIRILDSPGMKMVRANIESQERRSDQLQNIGRLGGRSTSGTFNTECNPGGEFDILLEDLVRGTTTALAEVTDVDAGGIGVGTKVVSIITPATPIFRGYTIDQYDIDIDISQTFFGTRVVGADFSFQPGEMAGIAWQFQGLDHDPKTTGTSPWFTAPTLTSGLPLIADDAVVSYAGSVIAVATGLNVNVAVEAALQPVLGSFVSPDVFMNMLKVTGDISVVREDLQALIDFDAETEFEIKIVLQAPGSPPVSTFAIIMRRVKIMDLDAPFAGGEAAKIETRQFWSHPESAASNAIEFYSSTETPTIV